jgi:hypothetical protein
VSDRPPVYDPNARNRPMNLIGKVVIAVCLAAGLVFVAAMILMSIALANYGNNK